MQCILQDREAEHQQQSNASYATTSGGAVHKQEQQQTVAQLCGAAGSKGQQRVWPGVRCEGSRNTAVGLQHCRD
jgi:hypothetical protein